MAKKKAAGDIKLITKDRTKNAIVEKFGSDILISGNCLVANKVQTIPVSPSLDYILGGGISEGSFCTITGPPKVGKTSMCLHFAGIAQQKKYATEHRPQGRHVYFFNIEGRIKKRDLEGIKHLKLDEDFFTVIKSSPGNILTAEAYLDIGEQLINSQPGDIFIFDSFSQLCDSNEMSAEVGEQIRPNVPKLLSRFCRRICNVLPINKNVVMGITHLIANHGHGHATYVESSGRKIQYQVDVKLHATHCKPWMSGETQIGQDVNWKCETSSLGCPGGKTISKFRYGLGLDTGAELCEIGAMLGLLQKKGAWYSLPTGEQAQGVDKMAILINDNQGIKDKLYSDFRAMLGF